MKRDRITKTSLAAIGTILVALSFYGSIGCDGTSEPPPVAFDANYRLVIPVSSIAAPTINGLLNDGVPDNIWDDAFRLELIDADSIPGAEMYGVADSNNIYLYFEIEESGFTVTDTLAVALNPTSVDTDNRLLLIKPCPSGAAGCPGTDDNLTPDIDYFVDSDADGTWEPGGSGHGVTAKTATSGGVVWTVEMSIPRGAPYNFPSTEYFGLYANIIETDDSFTATQYTWPFNNEAGGTLIFGTPEDVPDTLVWGNATLNTSIGNGVRINSNDISTNHGPSTISADEPNTFYATAHNNTLNSGTLVAAEDVRATFNWANFGLPSYESFQKIPTDASPAAGNPTAYVDIPPTDSTTYQLNWEVPDGEEDFYLDNDHWCIKVELDSTAGTLFYRQQAQRNMDFVETGSPFESKATVDTKGYKLADNVKEHEFILDERFYNVPPDFKWTSTVNGAQKVDDTRYKLTIPSEQKKLLNFSILPPDFTVPSYDLIVESREGGTSDPFTRIDVRTGQLITLISYDRQGVSNLPEPIDPPGSDGSLKSSTAVRSAVMETDQPQSNRVLRGSWDNFQKSNFLIGHSMSFKVPRGAKALSLVIEGKGEEQSENDPYKVKVFVTDLKAYHIAANSSLILNRHVNGTVNLGVNLPTVIYRGKRKMGGTITIDKKTFNVYQSVGAFGYIVKGSKRDK